MIPRFFRFLRRLLFGLSDADRDGSRPRDRIRVWMDDPRDAIRQRFEGLIAPHVKTAAVAGIVDELVAIHDRQNRIHCHALALLMIQQPLPRRLIYDADCEPHERIPTTGIMVFGNPQPKPIKTNIRGRIRLRLRNDEWGAAFIRTKDGIRRFHLVAFRDHWELALEHGCNVHYRRQ